MSKSEQPKDSSASKPIMSAYARALTTASGTFSTLQAKTSCAATHPAVGKAHAVAQVQVARLRDALGRSDSVLKFESLAGVDRVYLVLGSAVLFTLLVLFNVLGLAQVTTTAICYAWPSFHALSVLEGDIRSKSKEHTRNLLAYFVILAYLQVLEGLFAGVAQVAFARYYLLKIAVMSYMGHFGGAALFHDMALKNLVAEKPTTPVSENSSYSDLGACDPLEKKS